MPPMLVLCLLALLPDSPPDTSLPIWTLIEAERNFARMSIADGMRDAFYSNLRDDAIVFPDGPANGKEIWKEQKPVPLLLIWEPAFADLSESGDFGFTTGPSEMIDHGPDRRPPYFGYFVSVWKKDARQQWGVALDIGIRTPHKSPAVTSVAFPAASGSAGVPRLQESESRRLLSDAHERYAKAMARTNSWDVLVDFLHSEARIYRHGYFPVTGLDSVREFMTTHAQPAQWETLHMEVSSAGDMGYSYGSYRLLDTASDGGHWVKIWKRDIEGWKIVVDVAVPPRPKVKPSSP